MGVNRMQIWMQQQLKSIAEVLRSLCYRFRWHFWLTRKTRIFAKQYPIGSKVKVVRENGRETSGRVISYGRDYVRLDTDRLAPVIVWMKQVEESILLGWPGQEAFDFDVAPSAGDGKTSSGEERELDSDEATPIETDSTTSEEARELDPDEATPIETDSTISGEARELDPYEAPPTETAPLTETNENELQPEIQRLKSANIPRESATVNEAEAGSTQVEGKICDYNKRQGYGQLEYANGLRYNFRRNDIDDESLVRELNSTSRSQFTRKGVRIPVLFEVSVEGGGRGRPVNLRRSGRTDDFSAGVGKNLSEGILSISDPFTRARDALLNQNDLKKSAELFRVSVDRRDNFEESLECLARVLEELGCYEEAANVLARHLPQVTERRGIKDILARLYLRIGDYSGAASLLQQKLQDAGIPPGRKSEILWRMASCHIRNEDYVQAENTFKAILGLQSANTTARRGIALCLLKQRSYDPARERLEKIVDASGDAKSRELLENLRSAEKTGHFVELNQVISVQLDEIDANQLAGAIGECKFEKFVDELRSSSASRDRGHPKYSSGVKNPSPYHGNTLETSKKDSGVSFGKIVSFGSQHFGFIEDEAGEIFFFRLDDIYEDDLRQALLDGVWRSRANVEFESIPTAGHKYDRASKIVEFRDAEALLGQARQLLLVNRPNEAIAVVRQLLTSNPDNEEARKLEATAKEETRRLNIGLPKGENFYARAKRADADRDWETAERLYRQVIQRKDPKSESARKDLASLLQRQGRAEEAIALLEEERSKHPGTSPYDKMLATIYQHAERYEEAVEILKNLAKTASHKELRPIRKQIAFSYFKNSQYDESEKVLREILKDNPGDEVAKRWLTGLEEARQGSPEEAAYIIGELKLSKLALTAVDNCEFVGIAPSKLQSGNLTERDVNAVEELAKKLGTDRPRERAAYYLSAAAIVYSKLPENDMSRVYEYLRRYFSSMGHATWVDRGNVDVARTYHVESLALVSERVLDEAWRTLVRYLATFCGTDPKVVEKSYLPSRRSVKVSDYIDSLCTILGVLQPDSGKDWLLGLLYASSRSNFVAKAISDVIEADPSANALFAQLLDIGDNPSADELILKWKTRCRNFSQNCSSTQVQCEALNRHQLTAASMEELLQQLRQLSTNELLVLDCKRLDDLIEIAELALRFSRTSDFEEKEHLYWQVKPRSQDLVEQIEKNPTHMSLVAFLPVVKHLKSLTEEEYAETERTSGAQLELSLLVKDYTRRRGNSVKLQVKVANKQGRSPASSVRLNLDSVDSSYFTMPENDREIAPVLRGGKSVTEQIQLALTNEAEQVRAFPIKLRAIYRDRGGEEHSTEEHSETVRLYSEDEFRKIDNRYAPFADGGPVDNPEMFFGRDLLLDQLRDALLTETVGKCIVVFGQKRTGKTSLLSHLKRKLNEEPNCLSVDFSLYDLGSSFNETIFFEQVLTSIVYALEDSDRWQGAGFKSPTRTDLERNPTMEFHAAMRELTRKLGTDRPEARPRLVLLIDEFTEIYKQIKKKAISPGFMKAWKGIVEKHYFASVLVGQDIMPNFKASFSNEFGVTEDVRITYLSKSEARRLIEEPVGSDRYAGNALPRILSLTAGSPFYTMMFCNRLINYMNTTRSMVVTEADINTVKDEMISGDGRLSHDKFDNLIRAGDGVEDSGIEPEETLKLCREIARGGSGEGGWCSRDAICGFEDRKHLEKLLTDVERRDVVERKGDAYRLRVGLFHEWLLV